MTGTIEVRLSFTKLHHNVHIEPRVAIRKSTAWYNTHISLARPPIRGQPRQLPPVILLTDDAANRQKAEGEGLQSMSGECYWVEGYITNLAHLLQ